jgi:hypothetical protein
LYRLPMIYDFYRKKSSWKDLLGSCFGIGKEKLTSYISKNVEEWIYGSRMDNTFLLDDRYILNEADLAPNFIPMVPFWVPENCCHQHCHPKCTGKRWLICQENGLKVVRDWMMKCGGIGIMERLDPILQLKTYYVDYNEIYGGQRILIDCVKDEEWEEFHVTDLEEFEL